MLSMMMFTTKMRIPSIHLDNFENLTCSKPKILTFENLTTMLTTKMMMMLKMVITAASQFAISSAR